MTPTEHAELLALVEKFRNDACDVQNDDGAHYAAYCIEQCASELAAIISRATPVAAVVGNRVAWAWRTKRGVNEWTHEWALSHNEPTRENCHLKDGDEIEVRQLGFIDVQSVAGKVEGWVLVPVEFTDEMKAAFEKSQECCSDSFNCNCRGSSITFSWGVVEEHYKAALAAAPSPHGGENSGEKV